MASIEDFPVGSRWRVKHDNPDMRFEVRVMAHVEGYIVYRLKGCMPFCARPKEFAAKYESPVFA